MTQQHKDYDISWSQFEVCNDNCQIAFENMCRWLFNDYFFKGKALLHSNPNNPGIEVVPQMHPESNKRVSFQAKYFSTLDYEQIKHSAQKTVEYYSEQLDVVYLYCNKDVTTTSAAYQNIEKILGEAGIQLIPVTNQTILEQVLKNETMAWYYFNQIPLPLTWFAEQLDNNLESLGPRYNDEFNVVTRTEELLNCFLCNEEAVQVINKRKCDVVAEVELNRWKYRKYKKQVSTIMGAIEEIEDVTITNVGECVSWLEHINNRCTDVFADIRKMLDEHKKAYSDAMREGNSKSASETLSDINKLQYLLNIPQCLAPNEQESLLIQRQVVVVKGNAGVGKSQLFANSAEGIVSKGQYAVLMLGTNYLTNTPLSKQIMEVLDLNLTIDAFLHKMEALGIQEKRFVYIFIDAINESTYKEIWQVGLSGLLSKLKAYPHIKLALSVRTGYEKLVFNESILGDISNGTIGSIMHNGFREESIVATQVFLNHYGIPFSPTYFLQSEMTNPLFLTLFCQNYTGTDFDMFTLFEKVIEKAEDEAQKAVGMQETISVLNSLVDEMVGFRLTHGALTMTQEELFELKFWERYGLTSSKIPFVSSLVRSGFLISTAAEHTETYYLGYNLLEDFVCAKTILREHPQKEELISYVQNDLLKIENGCISNFHNIDIFIEVCGLYAEKYHEECFEDIEVNVTDEFDKNDIVRRYLESFVWRKSSSVDSETFRSFINRYPIDRDDLFSVLIENSTKEQHPLNASFLHKTLKDKELAYRDALWTTYINNLSSDDERIFQLIMYFDSGKTLDGLSETNTELLLILFAWLLTSSNRFLRDKVSKAIIELLKRNFALCKPLLQHFEGVNDPYVIQRLYGCVLGACLKRVEEQRDIYKELAEYIYAHIFDQENVYPDILLRDYARLILERWKYEYPDERDFIDDSKIIPPYNSLDIPEVERQEYYVSRVQKSGFNRIEHSMQINHADCPGMYGDFGRYTFQSAIEDFVGVDVVNLYHYAMQFIRDELGYSDELLGAYDSSPLDYRYNRHDTKKIERIGKKYQWIALYNILARISDRYLVKGWDNADYRYEGTWEPYVRDFDPTLNQNTFKDIDIPVVKYPLSENEFLDVQSTLNMADIQKWKHLRSKFFATLSEKLAPCGENGNEWIVLNLSDRLENKSHDEDDFSVGLPKGKQIVWLMGQAFFVSKSCFEILRQRHREINFSSNSCLGGRDVYQLFNREYTWSPGYQSVFGEAWVECELKTKQYRIVKEKVEMPDFQNLVYGEDGEISIPFREQEIEKRVPEDVIRVQIMPAYSRVLWEEQYDASQDEATHFDIPCKDIIEHLRLEQKQADGYFCSEDGTLVCFDGNLAGVYNGLLIRKDFLEKYLKEKDVMLCWDCTGEKQYFMGNLNQEWSRWSGFYYYENGQVVGDLESHDPTAE